MKYSLQMENSLFNLKKLRYLHKGHISFAELFKNMAIVYKNIDDNRDENALNYYEDALNIFKLNFPKNSSQIHRNSSRQFDLNERDDNFENDILLLIEQLNLNEIVQLKELIFNKSKITVINNYYQDMLLTKNLENNRTLLKDNSNKNLNIQNRNIACSIALNNLLNYFEKLTLNLNKTEHSIEDHEKNLNQINLLNKETSNDNNKINVVDLFSNVALLYEQFDQKEKALEYYKYILTLKRLGLATSTIADEESDDELVIGDTKAKIAELYEKLGSHKLALHNYYSSFEIYKQKLPNVLDRVDQVLSNVALIHELLGETERAVDAYEKLIECYGDQLKVPRATQLFFNIGLLNKKLGKHSTALKYFQKALDFNKNNKNSNETPAEIGLIVAKILNHMANSYDFLENYSSALQYYKQSAEIYKKLNDIASPNGTNNNYTKTISDILLSIAVVLEKMRQFDESIKYYKEGLSSMKQSCIDQHASVAHVLGNMAAVYQKLEQHEKALELHEEALQIYKNTLPTNHPSISFTLNNMAIGYHKTG
jgi:tetratricopeptide (TPR) repeat protein